MKNVNFFEIDWWFSCAFFPANAICLLDDIFVFGKFQIILVVLVEASKPYPIPDIFVTPTREISFQSKKQVENRCLLTGTFQKICLLGSETQQGLRYRYLHGWLQRFDTDNRSTKQKNYQKSLVHDHTFPTKKTAWKNIEYLESSSHFKKTLCERKCSNFEVLGTADFLRSIESTLIVK